MIYVGPTVTGDKIQSTSDFDRAGIEIQSVYMRSGVVQLPFLRSLRGKYVAPDVKDCVDCEST